MLNWHYFSPGLTLRRSSSKPSRELARGAGQRRGAVPAHDHVRRLLQRSPEGQHLQPELYVGRIVATLGNRAVGINRARVHWYARVENLNKTGTAGPDSADSAGQLQCPRPAGARTGAGG